MAMRFHALEDAPVAQIDVVFRPSRMMMAVGLVVTQLFTAGGVLSWGSAPLWFSLIFIAIGVLFGIFALRRLIFMFSPDSWFLRCNPRRVLIKVGPLLGGDLPQTVVAELELREIEWVRQHRTTTITRQQNESVRESDAWLEIKPRSDIPGLEELRQHLAAVRADRKGWGGFSYTPQVQLSVSSEGVLRLQWRGVNSYISPSLKRALQLLQGDRIAVEPTIAERNDFTAPAVDQEKMAQRIVELAQAGQIIEAMQLARKRYGYSLGEAQQFVEQLRSPAKAAVPAGTRTPPPNR